MEQEYKVRLGQTVDILALLWKSYSYFKSAEQFECSRNISLRILEHIYYKYVISPKIQMIKFNLQGIALYFLQYHICTVVHAK